MGAVECDRNWSTPAGITNQRSKAQPRPQISPAPGVVARFANTTPKTTPKNPPSRIPWVSDASSILLCSMPPSAPEACCKAEYSRSEEHTSELQSHLNLVCRLLLEKKKN